MAITKILLPADNDIKQEPLGFSLKLKSRLLEKKFKLYISSKFLYLSKLITLPATPALLLFVIFYNAFSIGDSKEQLQINLILLFLLPLFYLSTFIFNWSRRVNTYSKLFQMTVLVGSGVYSITMDSDYALLGVLVIQLLAIHFDTSYLGFFSISLTSLSMFAIA